MRHGTALLDSSLLAAALFVVGVPATSAAQLSEYGIEGMGVVSTRASEAHASVSPDGRHIVWASDRDGGWDLWQATLDGNRWTEPRPLPVNSRASDLAPAFSADGRWLYFASDRSGGHGGHDLYRAPVRDDGRVGKVQSLGRTVNTAGDERAPMPHRGGAHLLFASDGHGGAGGFDLFVASIDGASFGAPAPVPGINTRADETGGAWLVDDTALVFTRQADASRSRLQVARCDGRRYRDAAPLALSFNTDDAWTVGPALDWHAPGELLVSGVAKSPRAGQIDVYRMRAPTATGTPGCI